MDIGDCLRRLGLERYEPAFRDSDIVPRVLPELTDADLKELGLTLGHRGSARASSGAAAFSRYRTAHVGVQPDLGDPGAAARRSSGTAFSASSSAMRSFIEG